MRSCSILGVALLLTAATASFVVQARKSEEYGNKILGPGSDACRCGEMVVKAAKVEKPLLYASPEAINEAAVARAAVGRLTGTSSSQSESAPSFPIYKSYIGSGSGSGSSSSFSSSSSSSSSSSTVGILGERIGNQAYSIANPIAGKVISNCGCGKTSESLRVRDLLDSNIEGKVVPSFRPIGDLCYPSSEPNRKYQTSTKVIPAYPGKIKPIPSVPHEVCVQVLDGRIDQAGLRRLNSVTGGRLVSDGASARTGYAGSFGKYGSASYGSAAASYGSYGASGTGRFESFGTSSGMNIATSNDVERTADHESSCDFGDESELPEDYSYPRLPADPVSVTLAYKNIFPRTVYYNRKMFVPEDKLAFGHRTMPTETKSSRRVPDVPEERLQIVDKPVVELKPASSVPVTVGVYDEREEAKLAELEAIERERIEREEMAERQRDNFITYGDLGYAPIHHRASPTGRPLSNVEDDTEEDCGPVGPPNPDYVAGSVVVDEDEVDASEIIKGSRSDVYVRHYGDEISDEEDDDGDDSTSGIFDRLRSVARKYGSPCGTVA